MLEELILNKELLKLDKVCFPTENNFNFQVGNYNIYYDRKNTPRETLEGGDEIEWSPHILSHFPKKGALVSELSVVQKHEDYNICTTLAFRLGNEKLLSVENARFDKKSKEWSTLSRVEMYTKTSDTYHPIYIQQNTLEETINRNKFYFNGIEESYCNNENLSYHTPVNEQALMKNAIEIIELINEDNRKVSTDIRESIRESSADKLQNEVINLLQKNILDGPNAHIHHHLHM